jgi:hypothetical protein
MSGYVASARIDRAAPRLVRTDRAVDTRDSAPPAEPAEVDVIDAAGAGDQGPTFAERHAAFRARWSQLTFFLFDADSWRS